MKEYKRIQKEYKGIHGNLRERKGTLGNTLKYEGIYKNTKGI